MATSVEQCVRVKLFFDNACLEPSWFNVSVKQCKKVSDIEQRIISKFQLECDSIKLILSDCRLPSWERTTILRENDCLHVRKEHITQETLQEECDRKKKTKKKKSQRITDEETDEEREANCTDTSQIETCAKVSVQKEQSHATAAKTTNLMNHEHQEHTVMDEEETDKVSAEQSVVQSENNTFETGRSCEKKKRKRKRKNKKRDTSLQESNASDNHQAVPETSYSANISLSNKPYQRVPNNKRIVFDDDDGVTYDSFAMNGEVNRETSDSHLNGNSFDQNMMEVKFLKKRKTAEEGQSDSWVSTNSVIEESVLPSGITVYTRQKRQRTSYVASVKERHLNDRATNKSIILTNDASPSKKGSENKQIIHTTHAEVGSSFRKDYSHFPDLDCPPRNGDKIAYKIIELSNNYCPEVSDYKEARVLSYDPISTVVELELLTREAVNPSGMSSAQSKFSMDGDAEVSGVIGDNQVSVELGSLLESKLLS